MAPKSPAPKKKAEKSAAKNKRHGTKAATNKEGGKKRKKKLLQFAPHKYSPPLAIPPTPFFFSSSSWHQPSFLEARERGGEGGIGELGKAPPLPSPGHSPRSPLSPTPSLISFQDPNFFLPHPFLLGSFLDLSLALRRPFQLRRSEHLLWFPSSERPKFSSNWSCFWPLSSNQSKNKRLGNKCPWLPPIPGLRFGRIRPNFIVFCSLAALFLSPSCRKVGSIASPARLLRSGGERKRHKRDKRRALDAVLVVAAPATPLLVASPAVCPHGAAAGSPESAARSSAGAR